MTFKFVGQPLLTGRYEPEGIYLQSPLAGRFPVMQLWGEHAEFYGRFTYHGVPVKGHPGIDLAAPVGTRVQAVDGGRVIELNFEPGGFGRYLKIDHVWGESFYAHLEETLVDAGQTVARGEVIARSGDNDGKLTTHLRLPSAFVRSTALTAGVALPTHCLFLAAPICSCQKMTTSMNYDDLSGKY